MCCLIVIICTDFDIDGVFPDSKFRGDNMGPTWVLSVPDGPHVGHMNLLSELLQFYSGNSSLDCQLLAERTMLGELKKLGILRGDIDAMINERVAFVFMPHGIGHLIGVDVIDAGGITKVNDWHIKAGTISQMIFSNVFSWVKTFEFQMVFHWNAFLSV